MTAHAPSVASATRKHIRGSSMLLTGRALSAGIKFFAQLLIIRYLTTRDYGAWAYALAVVSFFGHVSSLGLKSAAPRFLPIYHERGEYGKFFGTMALIVGVVIVMGTLIVAGVQLMPERIGNLIRESEAPVAVLLVLIFLVPLDDLDALCTALFASFDNPRAIFVRRYVLNPTLQLATVIALIVLGADVLFLAAGWLGAWAAGTLYYMWMAARLMRRKGLTGDLRSTRVTVPTREIFSYTVPFMTSDWLAMVLTTSGPLLLGYFAAMDDVARFRAVVPLAVLNQIAMQTFALLYTPAAARLYAKDDRPAINTLYWRTAAWLAVLTFPVFAVTFLVAEPLTVLLYGSSYAESGVVLSLLAVGYYFNAALGFNGVTIKVVGRVKYMVVINFVTAAVNIALSVALIPRFGALGAAIATAASLILHNLLKQAGLRLATGVRLFDGGYLSIYISLALAAAALIGVRLLDVDNHIVTGTFAALAAVVVLGASRKRLEILETFPELRKVPVLRMFFA